MPRPAFLAPAALALAALLLAAPAPAPAQSPAGGKIKITSAADLPVHTYTVTSRARPLAEDPAAVSALTAAVSRDTLSDLAHYDIPDRSTLRGMYLTLEKAALLQQDYEAVRRYIGIVRGLQDKPADKATSGLFTKALADALQHPGTDFHQTFQANLERAYRPVPADWARADAREGKSGAGIITRDLVVAAFTEKVDTPADTSRLSRKEAVDLLSEVFALRYSVPNKDTTVAAFSDILVSHPAGPKVNIWTARDLTLPPSARLTPTAVGIWDLGVDISLYKPQLVSGQPGIAFDEQARPTTGLLYPLPGVQAASATYISELKGMSDFKAGIDSPEATALKTKIAAMTAAQVSDFDHKLIGFSNYAHGTHVAGVALRGNPAARLLVCRLLPDAPASVVESQNEATMYRQSITYFKTRGVRVVNMSWDVNLSNIEAGLEERETGKTAEERRALAKRIYDIGFRGLSDAIHSAPDILFVAAAGNENSDISFDTSYPASIHAPNLMVVGAVDQSGEETSFTSFGNVDVYADGVDVPSFVPGGAVLKLSGTSMAAPQVTNLAAKLLAVRPSLSPALVRAAIVAGADRRTAGGKTTLLINPRRTLAALTTKGGTPR